MRFKDGLCAFEGPDYDPTLIIQVTFLGPNYTEFAVDQGGPRRCFFQKFIDGLAKDLLDDDGNFKQSPLSLEGNVYLVFGKAIGNYYTFY